MLSSAPTGLASSTASTAFHGPGRGAGNSIVALLNAFRVTRSRGYLDYAESLVRRCIHPADDLAGRQLQDTERRWSYTVFLQALARYLDDKAVLGEIDCRYAYARDSLIAYARWMADYERPYLERPEILEFKTETWAAQDLRKSEVLLHASRYVGEPEQTRFRERAAFFRAASFDWLHRFETRGRARPVVLLLSNGYLYEAARVNGLEQAQAGAQDCDFGHPELFKPQRAIAIRRAGRLAAAGGAGLLVLAAWLVANYAMR
jgi:hypothetical protein